MTVNSSIEWTDATFNPWEGCQKVGPGCDHCYAETRNARFGGGTAPNWGPGAPRRRTSASNWRQPVQWNAKPFYECELCGWRGDAPDMGFPGSVLENCASCPSCAAIHLKDARRRVFCASLADVFDNEVDREWRDDLATLIFDTPNLDWLLLTKRIGNAAGMLAEMFVDGPPPNLRIGASICTQEEADRDIIKLLRLGLPNFFSMEPLLGAIDLERPMPGPDLDQGSGATICQPWYIQSGIDWVIVGGESGRGARPMSIQWVRELRDQCMRAGVPFLFKQWGEWAPARPRPAGDTGRFAFGDYTFDRAIHHEVDCYPRQFSMFGARCVLERVGKKAAGRLLDGRTWDGFPI